jgi:hypothetical protein
MATGIDERSRARARSVSVAALTISAAVAHRMIADARSLATGWGRLGPLSETGVLTTSPSWVGGGVLLTAVELVP